MTVAMPDQTDPAPIDETLWERRMQAVSLRNGGMTFAQIAAVQGISPAMVRRDIEAALRDYMSGQMDLLIASHRSIVADMRRANYPGMLRGEKEPAKTILDGMAHEAKLLGMYAPTRVVTGVNEVEFSERFVELINAVSPNTLKELLSGAIRRNAADHADDPVDAEVVADPGDHGQGPGGGAGDELDPGPGVVEPDTGPLPDPGPAADDGWSNLG